MLAQPHAERTIRTMTPTSTCAPPAKTGLRRPLEPGQHTSWEFSQRVRAEGLVQSFGRVGDAYDNAAIEAFWARLQTELLEPTSGRPESSCPPPSSTGPRCSTIETGATSHLRNPSDAINNTNRAFAWTPTSTLQKAEHTSRGLTTGSLTLTLPPRAEYFISTG